MGNPNDMVERVAKAAHDALLGDDGPSPWPNSAFSVSAHWFRVCARAAIAAMREPTEEMCKRQEHVLPKRAGLIWRAMIDEALKD